LRYEQDALPQLLAEYGFDTGHELDTIALRPQSEWRSVAQFVSAQVEQPSCKRRDHRGASAS
jgi:hypothetical protein